MRRLGFRKVTVAMVAAVAVTIVAPSAAAVPGAPAPTAGSTPPLVRSSGTAVAEPAGSDERGGLEADTSAVGSFTNSVPIDVPAFHGLEPPVSLEYDSNGGNGELGVGWRLNAGSRVLRSGADNSLPRFDGSDVFALDGVELVPCAPKCVTGGTHESREQSFQRIVFDPVGQTWTRWTVDGTKYNFAAIGAGAAAPFEWLLDSTVDTHGNTVRYSYDCSSGHCYLARIRYAASTVPCGRLGQPVCKAGALIRFWYEQRSDEVAYSTGRDTRSIRLRLKSVEIRMDERLVGAYALTYRMLPGTNVSALSSLQQFPDDALVVTDPHDGIPGTVLAPRTPPLPPMTFASTGTGNGRWQYGRLTTGQFTIHAPPGRVDYPVSKTTLSAFRASFPADGQLDLVNEIPAGGDFDGDGRSDMATWTTQPCTPTQTWRIRARLATGALVVSQISCTNGPPASVGYAGDVNGDQADDLLLLDKLGRVRVALSRRDGHFTVPSSVPQAMPWGSVKTRRCSTGDLNGDDLTDLACIYQTSNGPRLGTALATRAGGFTISSTTLSAQISAVGPTTLFTLGDVDASGTADVMLASAPTNGTWRLRTGYTDPAGKVSSWSPQATHTTLGPSPTATWALSGGDIDADRRTDYILISNDQDPAGGLALVARSLDITTSGLTFDTPIHTTAKNLASGDADGDGRTDLLTGYPLGALRSNGNGTFTKLVWPHTSGSCRITDPEGVATAGDVNGDGQADLTCIAQGPDIHTPGYSLWTQPSPVAFVRHRWQPLDDDGDGRQDLVYLHFANRSPIDPLTAEAYHVYLLHGQPNGTYKATERSIRPIANVPLNNPAATDWMPIDVGGPEGRPDGRSDLVLLDRDTAGAVRVITLLSTPQDANGVPGWELHAEPLVNDAGVPVTLSDANLRNWRPATVNRAGRTDLVHMEFADPGLRVRWLVSHGDGRWTARSARFFGATADGGPLTRPDVSTFRALDDNLDGLTDFRHVDVDTGAAPNIITVRTLISTGPGQWREETRSITQSMEPGAGHRLRSIDVDGDHVPDLGRPVLIDGCLRIQAFLRVAGTWTVGRLSEAPAQCKASSRSDLTSVVLADVNHDDKTDLYRMTKAGIYTQLNPGNLTQPWLEVPQPPISTSADTWAWFPLDTDHDGHAELAHTGASLETLTWLGDAGRLTEIDNGRGAVTTIAYRAQAEARRYLPVGTLPQVVATITLTDHAYTPANQSAATFDYHQAEWSDNVRRMIGYGAIDSTQGTKIVHTDNELTDSCGARKKVVEMRDTGGAVFNSATTNFRPAGSNPPFTCQPERVTTKECELSPTCRTATTRFEYDRYGNRTLTEESTPDGRRQIRTPFSANPTDYIVDKPASREILTGSPGGWLPQARSLYAYDKQPPATPPTARGDLTELIQVTDLPTDTRATTTYEHDTAGNITKTVNPVGVTTTTVFDPDRSLFPERTCNLFYCTTNTWDEIHGVISATTDANQRTTTIQPDPYGRPQHTMRPDGSTTHTSYLDDGRVTGPETQRQRIRTETSDGSPRDGTFWQEQLVDGLGRVYQIRSEGVTPDADDVLVTDTRYKDATAAPAATTTTHRAADTNIRWTNYHYDPLRRVDTITHPGNSGSHTTRRYDVGAIEDKDELGHRRTTHRDAFGRISSIDEQARTCFSCPPTDHSTSYRYDATDQLIQITDAENNITTITRDSAGRPIRLDDPDRGTTSTIYRPDGTIDRQNGPAGNQNYSYDTIGRPTGVTATGPTGRMTTTWDYDVDATTRQPQGESIGLPTKVTYRTDTAGDAAVNGTERTWYDPMGRPNRTQQCVDTICYDMGYTYDPAGRLDTLNYPNPGAPTPETVSFTYDPAGRLASVGAFLTGIIHDPTGAVTAQKYGNGYLEHFSYDPDRLWLTTHTYTTPLGTELYAADYTHDDASNITAIDETPTVPSPQNVVHKEYRYDELNRLNYQSRSDRPTLEAETYDYDPLGRITRSPNAGTIQYNDPAHVHAPTTTGAGHERSYNNAGHLTHLGDPTGRDLTITWTPTGMPQTIADGTGTTHNAYAPDGHRIKEVRDHGEPTRYLNRYLEHTAAGLTKNYYAGDQLIARRDPTGALSYPLQDHLHSTRIVTDDTAGITARYDYEPYGKVETDPANTNQIPQQWNGNRQEPDSGLTYMSARFYDPELGQFTTPDTIIPDPYRPQSLNPYSYVEGNPITYTDPTGHMPMNVERKKEQQSGPSGARLIESCGAFVQCVYYRPAMTVTECYGWQCKDHVGQYVRDIRYTGGVDANGNWDFGGSVSDTTVYGLPGNPSEWAQWPGEKPASSPPLTEAPIGIFTSERAAVLLPAKLRLPTKSAPKNTTKKASESKVDVRLVTNIEVSDDGRPFCESNPAPGPERGVETDPIPGVLVGGVLHGAEGVAAEIVIILIEEAMHIDADRGLGPWVDEGRKHWPSEPLWVPTTGIKGGNNWQ
jgi:RHS repeat-associated protein